MKKTNFLFLAVLISTILIGCTTTTNVGTGQESRDQDVQITSSNPTDNDIWFSDLLNTTSASQQIQINIARSLAEYAKNIQGVENPNLDFEESPSPTIIFISLSDSLSKADVLFSSGESMKNAFYDLKGQILEYRKDNPAPEWIKVDFVRDVVQYTQQDLSLTLENPRSLYGLAFSQNSNIAILPEVLVAETILDSTHQFRQPNLVDYLNEKESPPGFVQKMEDGKKYEIFRFSTDGYFFEKDTLIPLYRGHRMFSDFTPSDLLESAISAGDYLIDAVKDNGEFVYSYLPKSDREQGDYNILRHAGTIYSMLDLYRQTNDERILTSVDRAVSYLMTYIQLCPVNKEFENCIVENDETKLGGNALAVLALANYIEILNRKDLLDEAQSLARWIVSNQSPEGEFIVHKVAYPSNEPFDSISQYYPGEAIYALANLYRIDPDPQWLSASIAGAKWLSADRILGKESDDITHDHWLLLGLDALQKISPDPVFYTSSLQLSGAIMDAQNLQPLYEDWYGSYYDPPQSTPTATRTEGLMAAFEIVEKSGTAEQSDAILQAASRNVSFQLGTQFYPESVMYLSDPQRSLGAFHKNLTNHEIRIDYIQHNISGILALYRVKNTE